MIFYTGDTRPFYIHLTGAPVLDPLTGQVSAVFVDSNGLGPITNVVPMSNLLPGADWEKGIIALSFPAEETAILDNWHNKTVSLQFSYTDSTGKRTWTIKRQIMKGNA